MGTGAKIGIGCGAIVLLAILGVIIAVVMFGGKMKQLGEDMQKNPTRTTATMMVSMSGGALEMIAEDDANKRYTIKEKKSGTLTTVYWDEKKQAPEVIPGDFSAIPAAGTAESTPVPEAPEP